MSFFTFFKYEDEMADRVRYCVWVGTDWMRRKSVFPI